MVLKPQQLYGRQVLSVTQPELSETGLKLKGRPAILEAGDWCICQRCGQKSRRNQVQLPDETTYCCHCFQLGRVTSNQSLWSLPEENQFSPQPTPLTWQGRLTTAQATCSREIRDFFQTGGDHLLWAVTGAGKTEMLFEGVGWALSQGLRVAIASPRVDVCLELMPRFEAAFATVPQVTLHGDMPGQYQYCQLTICTTHQLLRFYHAFDVLVIDEVDAFPFAADDGLHYAAQQAKKQSGALLYLTATPSQALLKSQRQGRIQVSYLPARYHGYPLPEITVKLTPAWRKRLKKGRLPSQIRQTLMSLMRQQHRFLIFVPHIIDLAPTGAALKQLIPDLSFETVHAADPKRHEKVQLMRDLAINCLITTTILERGVTFPGIDVIVIGANDPVFSTAALVQIAGRVGRKETAPTGLVRFFADCYTREIREAKRQIKFVNSRARRSGLLKKG